MKFLFFLSLFFSTFLQGAVEIKSVFDIGTGKIKMQVAAIDQETSHIKILFCQAEPILKQGSMVLSNEEMIAEQDKDRILSILQLLKQQADHFHPIEYQGIATEIYRRAKNGSEIIESLASLTGINIEIVSQEKEGILGFLTAVQEGQFDPEKTIVWDIGSGSFQMTCKTSTGYLVYTSPYGKNKIKELLKERQIDKLQAALNEVPSIFKDKIQKQNYTVIGIGAHPKSILQKKTMYTQKDVQEMLEGCSDDTTYSDLLLVSTVMNTLFIHQVNYLYSHAGNTTGFLLLLNQSK